MRCVLVVVGLIILIGPVSAQMPTVSREDLASGILAERMKVAEDKLDAAQFAVQRSEYALTRFLLTDAEFGLQLAIEFGLSPDHMAADYIREGIAKVRSDMEEWGADEDEAQAAQAWWQRLFEEHGKLASQVLDWVDEEAMLNEEETYWIPPYFRRVIAPELATFQEAYPTRAVLVALVPDADITVDAGWSQARTEDRGKDRWAWVPEVIGRVNDAMGQYVADSIAELVNYGKEQVMSEQGEGVPINAIYALDAARVVLAREPGNATAQMIHDKAMVYIEAFWEEWLFDITEMVMPEDVAPEDVELHQAMQQAYEGEAAELGWGDEVLRVVVTGDLSEGWEAWWVENVLHVGYFQRITGAVAVKQAEGCSVKRCLFRRQRQDDGGFSDLYLAKVINSYPILEENVSPG